MSDKRSKRNKMLIGRYKKTLAYKEFSNKTLHVYVIQILPLDYKLTLSLAFFSQVRVSL